MDGCLTWLNEGFQDLGLALYPEWKAENEGGQELTLLVTVWGWACLKTGLGLFKDRAVDELAFGSTAAAQPLPRCRWWPREAGAPSLAHPQPHRGVGSLPSSDILRKRLKVVAPHPRSRTQ